MAPIAKLLALLACMPLAASDCVGTGACAAEGDAVSLMQAKQILKHGLDREECNDMEDTDIRGASAELPEGMRVSDCADAASKGYCDKYAKEAAEFCPKTCGLCPAKVNIAATNVEAEDRAVEKDQASRISEASHAIEVAARRINNDNTVIDEQKKELKKADSVSDQTETVDRRATKAIERASNVIATQHREIEAKDETIGALDKIERERQVAKVCNPNGEGHIDHFEVNKNTMIACCMKQCGEKVLNDPKVSDVTCQNDCTTGLDEMLAR